MSIQATSLQATQPASTSQGAQAAPAANVAKTSHTASAGQTSSSSTSTAPASSTKVSISDTARALLAEATETSAQTAKEAGHGDRQAQRLLAKEQAAKAE